MKLFQYAILCGFCLYPSILKAQDELPPGPSEVYQSVNFLWQEQQFDVIESYLHDLLERWPGYVPAMIAEIKRLQLDGSQYEKSLEYAKKIEYSLEVDPLSVGPGFDELFSSLLKNGSYRACQ